MERLMELKTTLEKLRYAVQVFETGAEAKRYLLEQIPVTDVVGIGGCWTAEQLGLDVALQERGNAVYWHWKSEDMNVARAAASTADSYVCSANAITMGGKIVNIDGFGNRLAATLFGPKKVYMVIGSNKIATDLDAAMDRVKNVACPANAKRLKLNTPCAFVGHCTDCASPERMCNATLIFDRKPNSHPIEILLVKEELGF